MVNFPMINQKLNLISKGVDAHFARLSDNFTAY